MSSTPERLLELTWRFNAYGVLVPPRDLHETVVSTYHVLRGHLGLPALSVGGFESALHDRTLAWGGAVLVHMGAHTIEELEAVARLGGVQGLAEYLYSALGSPRNLESRQLAEFGAWARVYDV